MSEKTVAIPEEETESVFDDAEISEELPEDEVNLPSDEEVTSEWKPSVSKESPKDRLERTGIKAEMDGKTLTVKEYFFTRPKTKAQDGSVIPPKETQDGLKKFYPGKLGIKFEEENLVEYYPNFHYFINDKNEVSNFAKINRSGENAVSKIFKLVVAKLAKPEDEVSDQEVFEYLIGKKVKIKTSKGTFQGRKWFRNDIVGFEG